MAILLLDGGGMHSIGGAGRAWAPWIGRRHGLWQVDGFGPLGCAVVGIEGMRCGAGPFGFTVVGGVGGAGPLGCTVFTGVYGT